MQKIIFKSFTKRVFVFCFFFAFIVFESMGQSVIEVTDPVDADVVLLQVNNKEDADIVVYKTTSLKECKKWDCMWLFKKWGISDLSIFIYTDSKDTSLYVDDDIRYRIKGKVYFTTNINERGYNNPNTSIEGLIKKASDKDTTNLAERLINDSLIRLRYDSLYRVKFINDSIKEINSNQHLVTSNSSDKIVFKVQVGACHREIPEKELHKRYPGDKQISVEMHDGWYKYLIGNYSKYSEAKQEKISSGTPDAWVVVYKNDKRVSITEVINILSYYSLTNLIIVILS